ncbi:MAG: hypothetical protein LUD82_10000 [Clostridiales bacterium]|nr:hypothetical protein [Clostridiales bacterium]
MLSHDLRSGLWLRKYFILIPIIIALVCAAVYTRVFLSYESSNTLGMVLFFLMGGTLPAQSLSAGEVLEIPVLWLLFQTGCLVFTMGYPIGDLERSGTQILLRSGGRIRWWLSKCVWNVLSTILYNLALYVVLAVYCLVASIPLSLSVSGDYAYEILPSFDTQIQAFYGSGVMLVQLIVVPVLMMSALNLFQMLLSFALNQILGFVISVAWLVWSIFQISPLAIGNYGLMQRSSLFYSQGISFLWGTPLLCLVGLLCMGLGCAILKRKNILYTQMGT